MQVCGECGAGTEVGEDFCGECGAYLEWDGRAATPEAEPASPPAAQPHPPPAPAPAKSPPPREVPATAPGATDAGPRQPAPVLPGAPAPKPRRHTPTPDRERINPGDLVCGECGAGNKPTRKFCRRCGHDLTDAPVARVSWWRRLVHRSPRPGPVAGTRPQVRTRRFPRRLVGLLVVAALVWGAWASRDLAATAYDRIVDRVKNSELVNSGSGELREWSQQVTVSAPGTTRATAGS